MKCPYCAGLQTEVVETRDNEEIGVIRRRRSCLSCGKRFTTYERVETVDLYVIKKDGRRERFDRNKLKHGLLTACEKTTVPLETIEKIVADIERELRNSDTLEIKSRNIGEMAAKHLKKLDKVAYIRFARDRKSTRLNSSHRL